MVVGGWSRHDVVAVLVLVIAGSLFAVHLAPWGSGTTPDSLAYLEAARQLAAGHGLVLPDHRFAAAPGAVVPLTMWPPLYPALLSIGIPADPWQGPAHAAAVAAFLYPLTILLLFLLLRGAFGTPVATPLALAGGLSLPLVTVFAYAWSDALFLPLVLASVWLSGVAAGSSRRAASAAFVALALAVALAFATRYAGWPLMVLPLAAYAWNRRVLDARALFGGAAIFAGIVCAVLWRNFSLSGHWGGAVRSAGATPADSIAAFGQSLALFVPSVPVAFTILVAAIVAVLAVQRAAPTGDAGTMPATRVAALAALAAGAYLLALFGMSLLATFDTIDQRLLAPFLLLLFVAGLLVLPSLLSRQAMALAVLALLPAAAIVVTGAPTWLAAPDHWADEGRPGIASARGGYYQNFTSTGAEPKFVGLVDQLPAKPTVLLCERPEVMTFQTGIPAVALPDGPVDARWIAAIRSRPGAVLLTRERAREVIAWARAEKLKLVYSKPLAEQGLLAVDIAASFGPP